MNPTELGRGASTVLRDRRTGRVVDVDAERARDVEKQRHEAEVGWRRAHAL